MSTRWPVRRIVWYMVAAVAMSAGLWLMRGTLSSPESLPTLTAARPVTLSGLNRSGQVEVAVINLWRRPGFKRDNEIVARIQLPQSGTADAVLVDRARDGGMAWNQVKFREVSGWVVARFVVE